MLFLLVDTFPVERSDVYYAIIIYIIVALLLTNGYFVVLYLPSAPYVKVYLLNNGAYVAKKKTKIARKTLDPLYQQALLFEESPQGKVLQVCLYFLTSQI